MKIAATKVFADYINKAANRMGLNIRAELVYFTENGYTMHVNIWGPNWVDYDSKIGKFKAIAVSYPAEYYANINYLTTAGLCAEFRRRGVRDLAGLDNMLYDMIAI